MRPCKYGDGVTVLDLGAVVSRCQRTRVEVHIFLHSTHISGEGPSKVKNCVGFLPAGKCGAYVERCCRFLAPKGSCRIVP